MELQIPRGLKPARDDKLERMELAQLALDLVDVAPGPTLARLDGADDGVLAAMEVLGRVLVLGRVAAAHVTTNLAEAQMHPRVAHLQALFASLAVRAWVLYLVKV